MTARASAGLPSTIEETGQALAALAGLAPPDVLAGGVSWLVERTARGKRTPASPIGLYFARLWYSEEMYPLIFSAAGLGRVLA